jgi:hypothetical protein
MRPALPRRCGSARLPMRRPRPTSRLSQISRRVPFGAGGIDFRSVIRRRRSLIFCANNSIGLGYVWDLGNKVREIARAFPQTCANAYGAKISMIEGFMRTSANRRQ